MHSVYSAANDQTGKAWAQYLCIVDSGEEIYAFELLLMSTERLNMNVQLGLFSDAIILQYKSWLCRRTVRDNAYAPEPIKTTMLTKLLVKKAARMRRLERIDVQ